MTFEEIFIKKNQFLNFQFFFLYKKLIFQNDFLNFFFLNLNFFTNLFSKNAISDNEYNLILGQSDELHLNVSVTNEEESAYEAQLFVEHQKSVTYIAASKGQVICNRFNETIVACTLGNPFKRNALANVVLRFDPSALDDSEPRLSFRVFANSTSKQIIPREKSILLVNVIKKAELSIRGWQLPEQSFYGGTVVGESAMKYIEDTGTAVQHTYQIYNDGPWRVPLGVYIYTFFLVLMKVNSNKKF